MTSKQAAQQFAKQHLIYERKIRPLFRKALIVQVEPVIRWLQFNVGEPPLDALIDKTVFRKPMVTAYNTVGKTAAKRSYYLIRELDGSKAAIEFLVDLWSKIFRDYALNYAYRIENELSETTKDDIRKALADARELGYNTDETINLIRKRVQGQISRFRSALIARTEATTAANLGAEQGAKSWLAEQNQKGYKEYIGRADDRERETHRALNGTIIPMDEKFSFGGSLGNLPGDTTLPAKERVQCRCSCIFISERRYLRMMANKK